MVIAFASAVSNLGNKYVHLWQWNLRWKVSVFRMTALVVDIISISTIIAIVKATDAFMCIFSFRLSLQYDKYTVQDKTGKREWKTIWD